MNVDRNEKIWAFSNSGIKMHAFVQAWTDKDGNESTNHLRAMCRGTLARHAGSVFISLDKAFLVCTTCEKKVAAMWAREGASMQPATESDDLGFVPEKVVKLAAPIQFGNISVLVDEDHAEALEMDAKRDAETLRPSDAAPECTCGQPTPHPLGRNMHAVSCLATVPADWDALHAEALEMDELETALAARKPQRYHYRAVLAASDGKPLDGIEGYLNAIDRDAAETSLQERFATDTVHLRQVCINLA